jgi:hypothetical protein
VSLSVSFSFQILFSSLMILCVSWDPEPVDCAFREDSHSRPASGLVSVESSRDCPALALLSRPSFAVMRVMSLCSSMNCGVTP